MARRKSDGLKDVAAHIETSLRRQGYIGPEIALIGALMLIKHNPSIKQLAELEAKAAATIAEADALLKELGEL